MGTSTSQTHLEQFVPTLREVARQRNVTIRVVSDRRPEFDGVPIDWRRWSAAHELEDLRGFDVGIMPMPNDAWAKGKCAMKALLCMAVGVPVVCSAVGVNREIIEHGRNGFLASSDTEWLTHLVTLATDPALRVGIGAAGRATVEARYSMHCSAAAFAGVVERVAGKTPRREARLA
jgi:glycosyltransferase involved in cell wall biosynthesis